MAKKDSTNLSDQFDKSNIENQELSYSELLDLLKRTKADFDNYRKQSTRDQENLLSTAKASVLYSLIPALDNFYLSNKHLPEDLKDNAWVKGMQAISSQLTQLLAELDINQYSCLGQEFNPELAEAIEEVEIDSKDPSGTVIEELSPGWKISGLVVRPAKVKIKK